ncbi:hypothetical protein F4692_001479 [Nocardioides cavernae]|uniref:Uncharacterized protein n=1 Tax=Nocardioides cavernae TaxID=1921566 RepID=A0A7Y9H207_9ACTN|nr:hypothetical protein [Nocardioides cavernae]NYE36375.1 hypothetical protein [Nocardioides cavernae]
MSDHTPGAEPTPDPTPASSPSDPSGSAQANAAVETLKNAHRLDLGIIGAGLVAFIASLLPYYTVSVELFGASASDSGNAWSGGFLGWFGALLALVGAGVLVARILGVALPFPVRTTVLGLFAGAALLTLLALFVFPGGGCDDLGIDGICDSVDEGRGFGYWLTLLATLAGTGLAAVRRSAD